METSIIKAKAEIERRISNLVQTAEEENDLKLNYPEHYGIIQGYRAALSILESIQKETDETVSDDLNEAAIEYFKEALSTGNDSKLDAFRAGANWQKQKDNQNESDMAVIAHLDGVEKGKKIMREQMMRGALEGRMVVGDESQLVIPSLPIITRTLDDGDKVKVIIIKEDK